MRYILMDVEGTTTSLTFVKDVLFSYASKRFESYLEAHPEKVQGERKEFLFKLRKWVQEDSKEAALKDIQGEIWKQGFESGELKGHVYPDVPTAFKRWFAQNLRMGIYSSGSVLAQEQLFKHTEYGNLNTWIAHNFDTEVGPKRQQASYKAIAERLELPPKEILFLSDVREELTAAKQAGMGAVQVLRQGVASAPDFQKVKDFGQVFP